MDYKSQLHVILDKLARDGSSLNPNATQDLVESILAKEIEYVEKSKTHGRLSPDCHQYIGELLLWEDLWGENPPFPGVKPSHLREFEKENQGIQTESRWTIERMKEGQEKGRDRTPPRGPRSSIAPSLDQQGQLPRAVVFSPIPENYQWASKRAEEIHREFQESIREVQKRTRSFRVDWGGPKCGWDRCTGLPKNAVVVHDHFAYLSACGPGGKYATTVSAAWGPEYQLDYQRLEWNGRRCTVVWPEPAKMDRQAGEIMASTEKINQLQEFLQDWGATVEQLGTEYPICDAYADWKAEKSREGGNPFRPFKNQAPNVAGERKRQEYPGNEVSGNPYENGYHGERAGRSSRKRPHSEEDDDSER